MCVCVCVCVCAGECHGARYPCAWCGTGRARYRLCGRRLGIEARRRGQGVERDIGPSEKCGQKWRSGIWSAAQLDCFLTWQNHSARIVTLASLSSFGFSGFRLDLVFWADRVKAERRPAEAKCWQAELATKQDQIRREQEAETRRALHRLGGCEVATRIPCAGAAASSRAA